MNLEEAADALRTHFNTQIAIREPTVKSTTTNAQVRDLALGDTWVEFSIQETLSTKPVIGRRSRQRNRGRLRHRIYTKINSGDDVSRRVATSIQDLWEDAHDDGLSGEIYILESTLSVGNRVAVDDRDWWVDVLSTAFFYYHQPA